LPLAFSLGFATCGVTSNAAIFESIRNVHFSVKQKAHLSLMPPIKCGTLSMVNIFREQTNCLCQDGGDGFDILNTSLTLFNLSHGESWEVGWLETASPCSTQFTLQFYWPIGPSATKRDAGQNMDRHTYNTVSVYRIGWFHTFFRNTLIQSVACFLSPYSLSVFASKRNWIKFVQKNIALQKWRSVHRNTCRCRKFQTQRDWFDFRRDQTRKRDNYTFTRLWRFRKR